MRLFGNPGLKLLAVCIALYLFFVARGSSNVERSIDIPVTVHGVPEDLVLVDQSVDSVNVVVAGTLVGLRSIEVERLEYALDASGARPGRADFDVDRSLFDLPRTVRPLSRSPAQIELVLEPRETKRVPVRAVVEGQPAPGFRVEGTRIDPAQVRITGARPAVLRISEVATETIDVTGAQGSFEREVRVSPGAGHVWADEPKTVRVRVDLVPIPEAVGTPDAPTAAR